MRDIIFRGRRTDNDKWVEGFFLTSPEFDNIGISVITAIDPRKPHYVWKETVGQYTGLTDKNGKKIFEGDIHERENHFFVVKYGKYRDCETNEDGYGWYFEYNHKKGCEGFDGTENEYVNIVGNIHDNPELLEVVRK